MTGVTTAGPPPRAESITVLITIRDDPRLSQCLESLLQQSFPPDEILIADGGDSPQVRSTAERLAARDPRIRRIVAPGTIAETRNFAIPAARGSLIAFLDTDEIAPPDWLSRLLAPFADPGVGFAGGPTPAILSTCRTYTARYYNAYLQRFYDRVARHRPHALPMGNSAWRAAVFRQVGLLDARLAGIGSEDQDVALRALAAGWKGVYVPGAAVAHDFSEIGLRTLFHKQRQYSRGGYVVWRRRGATYEASIGRVLPYLLLPVGIAVGLALLPVPGLRWEGALLALASGIGLGLLALGLTVQGLLEDRRYPGYRYRVLEIWRRWATLVGALEGFLS